MVLSLVSGRLVGNVTGGFVVRTPSAIVTDLGTEFDVNANGDGATQVKVFKGKVNAEPATGGTASWPAQ